MTLDAPAQRPYGDPALGSHYQGQVAATESRYGAAAGSAAFGIIGAGIPKRPTGDTMSTETQTSHAGAERSGRSAAETLTVTDNRTGRSYEIPIVDGAVRSLDLRQIRTSEDDFGLLAYDPAFMNTASCRSAITFLDGDAGVLEYRGYPIEQLAEHSSYLEVAYLLVHGELPTAAQLDEWTHQITIHTFVHENIKELHAGLPPRRPPDGDAARRGRRAVDVLPRRQRHPRRARAARSRRSA